MLTNSKVTTPIGEGICQGNFNAGDGNSTLAEPRILVRLPINEMTKTALCQANCLTPNASGSGLWVFRKSECGGALLEFLILLAFGLVLVYGIWLLLW